MILVADTFHKEKCTVIQSFHGKVKLIKRSSESRHSLITLSFSNLKDCLEYVDKNQFQINIMHSAHPPAGRQGHEKRGSDLHIKKETNQ